MAFWTCVSCTCTGSGPLKACGETALDHFLKSGHRVILTHGRVRVSG